MLNAVCRQLGGAVGRCIAQHQDLRIWRQCARLDRLVKRGKGQAAASTAQKRGQNGAKTVVLTGVCYEPDKLGVAVLHAGDAEISYYFHERLPRNSHGTGDIFASAFTGALMRGKSELEAATVAAEFTLAGMRATIDDETHRYGTKFEKALPRLIELLK